MVFTRLLHALNHSARLPAAQGSVVCGGSRGMLAAGADAMSKWFGAAESPEVRR